MNWKEELQGRLLDFGNSSQLNHNADVLLISIKIRVNSGCFHREHSPQAYSIIDKSISDNKGDNLRYIEHENGPEVITYIELASSLIILAAAVIDIVNTIIKARSEGINKGDRPDHDIELITRGFTKEGKLKEERILRIKTGDKISKKELEKKLKMTLKQYFE